MGDLQSQPTPDSLIFLPSGPGRVLCFGPPSSTVGLEVLGLALSGGNINLAQCRSAIHAQIGRPLGPFRPRSLSTSTYTCPLVISYNCNFVSTRGAPIPIPTIFTCGWGQNRKNKTEWDKSCRAQIPNPGGAVCHWTFMARLHWKGCWGPNQISRPIPVLKIIYISIVNIESSCIW